MITSDLLLGWMHEDGYSLGESGLCRLKRPTTDIDVDYGTGSSGLSSRSGSFARHSGALVS